MRRIALVIHALHGGGAECVAAQMANHWSEQGDQVTLITLDTVSSDVYQVNDRVRRVGLNLMGTSRGIFQAIWNNRRRIRSLRSALHAACPDCVVSVTDRTNILTLLACRGWAVPVVIAEHSDPRHQDLGPIWERLRRSNYTRASAAVVLTQAVAEHFRRHFGRLPIFVVPNGIRAPGGGNLAGPDPTSRRIVAMGRLSPEKGFDRLIDAFASIAERHSDWQLQIAGEGPLHTPLADQIKQLPLTDRIQLVGWMDDPAAFLMQGAIFVLASHYEGFPVALLEAMAAGLAVISFDCDSGPREIVRHDQNGLLVPADDVQALATAMERLICDQKLRTRLGAAARDVVNRFSDQQFAQCWNDVLDYVLETTPN